MKESVFFQVTFGPTCDQATLEPSSSANIEIEEVELEVPNGFPKTLLKWSSDPVVTHNSFEQCTFTYD